MTDTYHNNSPAEHPDANELALYAECLRDGTDRIPQKVKDHVASCAWCRSELMAISDMLDTLPDVAEEPGGEVNVEEVNGKEVNGYRLLVNRRTSFSMLKLLSTAAAVAAVVLISWGIKQIIPGHLTDQPLATNTPKDTLTTAPLTPNQITSNRITSNPSAQLTTLPDTVLYAKAFLPDPVYENLVGAKYRAGSDPMVKGPAAETQFARGDTLKMSWTPDPGDTYVLIILDNKGVQAREIKTTETGRLTWKIDLNSGLYYWKFLGKKEMWKVGKFKVVAHPL
ncbi:MAG: hypothetical protein WC699_09520 [Bacteroidales bacterium]